MGQSDRFMQTGMVGGQGDVCVAVRWASPSVLQRERGDVGGEGGGGGGVWEMVPGRGEGRLVDFDTVLHLYDTATRPVRELALREPGKVGIYLCGPTVYGPPHLGHGRATLTYDILRRYLEWSGLDVRLVSNITDIDDKIIDRAQREGRPWQDIATKCEASGGRRWTASTSSAQPTTPTPPSTSTRWSTMIASSSSGHAYVTDDGVYLSVESVDDYGLLAHQSLDDMLAGGGEREVFGADQKRHPADFVLWKLSKPGEPAWPSPWGDGRPGWHSECVVMSLDLLGEGFDLHCGGMDLRFPHHENERAQAVALGKRFANHWMHHGFVVDAVRREDVEEPRQRGQPARPARSVRRARLPLAAAAEPLPPARSRSAADGSMPPPTRSPGSTPSPPGTAAVPLPRDEPDADVLDRFGPRWTTTSTRPRRWRCCSTLCAGPTHCSTPATRRPRPRPLVAAVRSEMRRAVGLRARQRRGAR